MKLFSSKKSLNDHRSEFFFVWNYLEWGGAQIYFLSIMRFVSQFYPVTAILPEHSAEKLLNYLKANNIEFEFFDGSIDLRKAETIVRKIERKINDFHCSFKLVKKLGSKVRTNGIVHIDVAPWANFTVFLYLLLKTNVFLTLHTPLPKISKWRKIVWKIKFFLLTRFDNFQIVTSNQKVRTSLQPFLPSEYYEKIEVAYSSINLPEIENNLTLRKTRREIADHYHMPVEKNWLCNVGQFIERKGCWVLLEALADLVKVRDDIFFYWLGTAPLDSEVLQKIEDYNLGKSFRYFSAEEIGAQRADLLNLLLSADLFVMPSLEEGLPVALIEAMALGKCCIATDIDAIPEALEHLTNGYLIAPNNVGQLEQAIEILIADQPLRLKLGAKAREKAVEKFDDNKLGEIMLALYQKALDQNFNRQPRI